MLLSDVGRRVFRAGAVRGLALFFAATTCALARPAPAASWPCGDATCSVERREVAQDAEGTIAEYTTTVRVGPGEHDRIGLHRVIREQAPGEPIGAAKGVFLVHGDFGSFRGHFFQSAPHDGISAPAQQDSFALYLARAGVDVWGIDLRWALLEDDPSLPRPDALPGDCGAFDFMEDWDTGTHAADVGTALDIARAVRLQTGSGYGPLVLSGFSRGAQIILAYAAAEAQQPTPRAKALLPVDMAVALDPSLPDLDAIRERFCEYWAQRAQQRAAGCYVGDSRDTSGVAWMAQIAPDATAPFTLTLPGGETIQPLTFRDLALSQQTAAFRGADAGESPGLIEYFHFFAGDFEPHPILSAVASALVGVPVAFHMPAGFLYTPETEALQAVQDDRPFQSTGEWVDLLAAQCDDPSVPHVPWFDGLSDVSLPVLYVGAEGGWGDLGSYVLDLVKSTDREAYIVAPDDPACPPDTNGDGWPDPLLRIRASDFSVSFGPFPRVACAFGHNDLFGDSAPARAAWARMLSWIEDH